MNDLTLVLSMPVWKRPGLTGAVMRWHKSLDVPRVRITSTVAGCSREKDELRASEHGWRVAKAANSPLSQKHCRTIRTAYHPDVDGVIHLNSDDFLSEGYLRCLRSVIQSEDPAAMCLRDQCYVTTKDPAACHHLKGATPGSGTYISKRVLERTGCHLWPGEQERHLDKLMLSTIRQHITEEEDILQVNNHRDGPVQILGIKQHEGEQMWSLRDLIGRVDEVSRLPTKPYLESHYKGLLSDPYIESLLEGGPES